ncbi:MAG: peptidylprolyl isomerase [Myxococcota bacterium]
MRRAFATIWAWGTKEPLIHFAAIGALIFFVWGSGLPPARSSRIDIDAKQIAARYQQRTGTAASAEVLQALVDREIEQALLFAEAQALSLGDGDAIVRRRLIQKMTLILDEAVEPNEPSNADLARFLAADPRRFARPPKITLTHVFFRASQTADTQARQALVRLKAGANPQKMGAPFLRGTRLGPASEPELTRLVDADFAREVFDTDDAQWFGPVKSVYGSHLVRVLQKEEGRLPDVFEIRTSLLTAWRQAQIEKRRAHALKLLRRKYQVVVTEAP